MKRLAITALVAFALAFGLAACGNGGGQEPASSEQSEQYSMRAAMLAGPGVKCYKPAQAKCPVTGEAISAQHYIDHEKGRIYFSSAEAKNKFQNNPEQYLDKLSGDSNK